MAHHVEFSRHGGGLLWRTEDYKSYQIAHEQHGCSQRPSSDSAHRDRRSRYPDGVAAILYDRGWRLVGYSAVDRLIGVMSARRMGAATSPTLVRPGYAARHAVNTYVPHGDRATANAIER